MTLPEFAKRHRLRVRRDEDGTPHVPGRDGQLYEHDASRLAMMYLNGTPRAWGNRKRACMAAGMELAQDGDFEGTLLFDPENDAQAALAIRVTRIKRRRVVSPETAKRLAAMSSERRANAWLADLSAA